jgi:putative phage-type endonuclease
MVLIYMENIALESSRVAAANNESAVSPRPDAVTPKGFPDAPFPVESTKSADSLSNHPGMTDAAPAGCVSRRLEMTQGTHEWDVHRAAHRNASEAGCIMQVSPFEPDTWAKLWALKTGRALKEPANAAMLRGLELEKKALACYAAMTGRTMQPQVFVKGSYSASLDGIDATGDIDLEIKCPYHGQASLLWQQVKEGHIPAHYYWQIQHQLYVAEAKIAHFFVYDGAKEGLLLEVSPDPEDIAYLIAQWDRFWQYIEQDIAPPLAGKDRARTQKRRWRASAAEDRDNIEARERQAPDAA